MVQPPAQIQGFFSDVGTGLALVEQRLKGRLEGAVIGVGLSAVVLWLFYPEVASVLSFLPKKKR